MWIPIRTLYMNEMKVEARLKELGFETFIPMRYDAPDLAPKEERCTYPLVPAIHNLLFVHHDYSRDWCLGLLKQVDYPISFIKKERDGNDYAVVQDAEMEMFIKFCNPMIVGTQFKTPEEIQIKAGMLVRVKRGELEGIVGKFVRYHKRHFIAIETSGICALMTIRYSDVEVLKDKNE